MNNSLVSVIMPTYNQDVFIGEAIKFVLGQTCLDLELTIVDNYSEDETQKIVESFDDDCIRYFKFANNEIIAASRNQGIEKSEGKYIAFIDSD
ncbi:MAG: glycosyltransferase, partial [Candidatus Omnitrophica bacterium]|nr:glycosyltransferase [Candidatus Omnitrophota bacterium]